LAELAGKNGQVLAMERIKQLKRSGQSNLKKYKKLYQRVKFICTDAGKGLSEFAPYDKIIVAAAGEQIPEFWLEQLKISGCLVCPVKSSLWLIKKRAEKEFEQKEFPGFAFVPLVNQEDKN